MRQLDDLKVQGRHDRRAAAGAGRSAASRSARAPTSRASPNPTRLKAELRIAETQTKDIRIGQFAEVDTRNGVVKGNVSRIDPAAADGTVSVDVILEGALPRGARPDLSVDGTIELERLDNVLYVGRPAFGQENSTVGLFKLDAERRSARAQVKLGRSSVNTIEVLDGLQPGDQVILSDMSAWDQFERIRLQMTAERS